MEPSLPQHMLSIGGNSKISGNLQVGTSEASDRRMVHIGSRYSADVAVFSGNGAAHATLHGSRSAVLILNSSVTGASCVANLTRASVSPLQLVHHADTEQFQIASPGGTVVFSNRNSTISGSMAVQRKGPTTVSILSKDAGASVVIAGSAQGNTASINVRAPSSSSARLEMAAGDDSFVINSLAQQLAIRAAHEVVTVSSVTADTVINADTTVGCAPATASVCARQLLLSASQNAVQVMVNGDQGAQLSIRAQADFDSKLQLESAVGAFVLSVRSDNKLSIRDGNTELVSISAQSVRIAGNATFGGLSSIEQDVVQVGLLSACQAAAGSFTCCVLG